jgi:hypothetical protein
MAICGCVLPAQCSQPAVTGGFIYSDLRSELSTHLALQALYSQSSPVPEPLLQAFPFPSTLGQVTLHQLSQACMFIYSSCGKWAFSPLLWSFPPTTAFTSFPTPGCWAGVAAPAFSVPACLQFHEGFLSPPLQCSVCPALFATCLFCCCYCLLFSFSFFPGVGRSVQWAMLIWPRVVCGNTTYHLAHLVVRVFPSHLSTGVWWRCGSPPGFSL